MIIVAGKAISWRVFFVATSGLVYASGAHRHRFRIPVILEQPAQLYASVLAQNTLGQGRELHQTPLAAYDKLFALAADVPA